jgi:hypothetical protein
MPPPPPLLLSPHSEKPLPSSHSRSGFTSTLTRGPVTIAVLMRHST